MRSGLGMLDGFIYAFPNAQVRATCSNPAEALRRVAWFPGLLVASCCQGEDGETLCGMSLNPVVQVWHVGMYRDPKTLVPIEYYNRFTNETTCQIAYVSAPCSPSTARRPCPVPISKWPVLWLQLVCARLLTVFCSRRSLVCAAGLGRDPVVRCCCASCGQERQGWTVLYPAPLHFLAHLPVQRFWCAVWAAVSHGHQSMCQGYGA